MLDSEYRDSSCNNDKFVKAVNIPIELYKSLQGKYFIGYADNLSFGNEKSAWARLYNPVDSGVILHVNVWTVADISDYPFRAQFWFNAVPPPSKISESTLITPSNTAICPPPKPRVKLQMASNVYGEPTCGTKAFVRRGQPEETMVETENGKLIFAPGGSFLVFISISDVASKEVDGRIAFGWWEEKIIDKCNG